jgi:phospholipase C
MVIHAISRREFLARAAMATGALALGCNETTSSTSGGLPAPDASGIEHIIVVMMENRSFDHLLGWLPGADGRQDGLSYTDRNGVAQPTHHLTDFQGCGFADPDHSYEGGRIEYNGGACDGWLRAGPNDAYAIGYYVADDLAFLGQAAPQWMTFDRYFAAFMGPTGCNRLYQNCAQTDRLHGEIGQSNLPTIWDRLLAAGLAGRYYRNGISFLKTWGSKYDALIHTFDEFLADCAAGSLPQVAFVDPTFTNDDHPHNDIRDGEAFLYQVYHAVTTSTAWPGAVIVINYDEWGGFFDHVPPPSAPIPEADQAAGTIDGLRGFRVPCLLISPFARRGFVSSTVYDHTSVLRLIEWRWGLSPLTVRDEQANNFADELDFSNPILDAPSYNVPPGPFGTPCDATASRSR